MPCQTECQMYDVRIQCCIKNADQTQSVCCCKSTLSMSPWFANHLRATLTPKGRDGSEDPSASAAIQEVTQNFSKEIPEAWLPFTADVNHMVPDDTTEPGAIELLAISLCGSKNGSVYAGLDNFGISTLRLQAADHKQTDKVIEFHVRSHRSQSEWFSIYCILCR